MSSIEHCDDSETQLYIDQSLEVRSDEICAESVLSTDSVVPGSKFVKDPAVDRKERFQTDVANQKDRYSIADDISIYRQSQNKEYCDNDKSYSATCSGDIDCFHHGRRGPGTEADLRDTHICRQLKQKQSDVLKPSSEVWLQ